MYENVQTGQRPLEAPVCLCRARGGAGREAAREAAPRTVVVHRQLISCCLVSYCIVSYCPTAGKKDGQKEQRDSDAEEEKEKCGRRN